MLNPTSDETFKITSLLTLSNQIQDLFSTGEFHKIQMLLLFLLLILPGIS